MKATTTVKDVLGRLSFEPVNGHPEVSVIQIKAAAHRKTKKTPIRREDKMTKEDWDKFEKDIADAFEQVP